jgi:hypothetical protein
LRAGPLSDAKIISLLNRYFVPVYTSNEDYDKGGSAPEDEKKAYLRIYHEALKEKRAAGSVCVYLLMPEGEGLASIIVSDAACQGRLQKFLEDAIKKLKTPEGKPLAEPVAQSTPPRHDADALVLHLIARVDHRGSWGEFPSENWIVLKKAEWSRLLPAAAVTKGDSWDVDKAMATRVLTHFYPQVETCIFDRETTADSPHRHRIDGQSLKATVLSVNAGNVRVRLEGNVKLKHTFYPGRDDDNLATSTVLGYADFDVTRKKVTSLRLVTEQALYGKHKFSVAVRSVP